MGVPINLPPVSPQPHTHLAFEGYQYAKEHGKGNEYNHRVLTAFFVEGQDIGQIDVLTRLAGEVGLNEKELEEPLRTRKHREAHRRVLRHACEEAGVPMFVIGDQVLVGLQERETLEAVIEEELKAQGNAAPHDLQDLADLRRRQDQAVPKFLLLPRRPPRSMIAWISSQV